MGKIQKKHLLYTTYRQSQWFQAMTKVGESKMSIIIIVENRGI